MNGYVNLAATRWAWDVIENKRLDPTAGFVLLALAADANRYTGRSITPARELERRLNVGGYTVRRAMERLRAAGVPCERRPGHADVWWLGCAQNERGGCAQNERGGCAQDERGPRSNQAHSAPDVSAPQAPLDVLDMSRGARTHAEMAGDVDVHATVAMIKSRTTPGAVAYVDGRT